MDRRRDILDALSRTPLFATLAPEQRARLASQARVVKLGAGQRLWRQGAPATFVALVLAGRCKLVRERAERAVIVDVAVPGDVLGAVGFTLQASYNSTVVCLRHARVLIIPVASLRVALQHDAQAAAALALDLAAQVRRLMGMVDSLSAGSVERRLASVLVDLAERAGAPFPGGVLIPLRLRRSDLASMAATTLESASRKISGWRRAGLVVLEPAGYLIRDLDALRRLAGRG